MSEQREESRLPPRRRRTPPKKQIKACKREIVAEMELGTKFASSSIVFGIPSFIVASIGIKWFLVMSDAPKSSQGSMLAFYEQSVGQMTLILLLVAVAGFTGSMLIGRGTHQIRLLARCNDGSVSRFDRSFLFRKVLSEKLRKERFQSISVQFSGDSYFIALRDHCGNDDPILTTKDESAYRAFIQKLEKFTSLRVIR